MKRIQVTMPDELYVRMTELGLSPSAVLQKAVEDADQNELLRWEMEQWLSEMEAEVGPPSAEDIAWVENVLAPLREREAREAGERQAKAS